MKLTLRTFFAPSICLALCACGGQNADTDKGTSSQKGQQALTSVQDNMLNSMIFETDELGQASSTGECVVLRTKLSGEKTFLKSTSDWRAVKNSAAYAAFKEDQEKYEGAKCSRDATEGNVPEECEILGKKIDEDFDSIVETPEWKKFETNPRFKIYSVDLERAKQIDCYKK